MFTKADWLILLAAFLSFLFSNRTLVWSVLVTRARANFISTTTKERLPWVLKPIPQQEPQKTAPPRRAVCVAERLSGNDGWIEAGMSLSTAVCAAEKRWPEKKSR